MIKENQIRKFIHNNLPDIKLCFFNEDKNTWLCVFQEDFKFPYIHLTEAEIDEKTILVQ